MIRNTTLGDWLGGVYLAERIDMTTGAAEQLHVAVRLFERWLGRAAGFQDLTKPNLLAWMRWLSEGRAPATVNSRRQGILAIWNAAADADLCPPPPKIAKLREPQRIPVAWSLHELETILRVCESLPGHWQGVPVSLCWKIALLIFWDTGCRLKVVLQAHAAHVDLAAHTLLVPAEHIKGRRADRVFPLHQQTITAVSASRPAERKMLFPFPVGHRQVWLHLKKILLAAELPTGRKRMFHCFRRTSESYAAAERGIEWAARTIGHGVAVARRSYISPQICRPPALIDALPRPKTSSNGNGRQLELF